jgi:hypothetical protein
MNHDRILVKPSYSKFHSVLGKVPSTYRAHFKMCFFHGSKPIVIIV